MKKSTLVIVSLMVSVVGVWGGETSLIPEMKLGSSTLNIRGFATGRYTRGAQKEIVWSDFWFLPKWQINESLSLDGEFDLAYDDQEGIEDNWLRVLRLSYRLDDNWKLNLGRLPLSTLYITPPPFLIGTIDYPKKPVNVYGWAAQLAGQLGDWSIKTDISGRSGVVFDRKENGDWPEWSGRLARNLGSKVMLGVTSQLSERSQMISLDYRWRPVDKLAIRGAWFRATGKDRDWVGAYSFASYRLKPWLEIHTQIEGREVGRDREVVSTNGIRLIGGQGQGCLTVDYESVLDGEAADRLLARFRVRF